jgi:hypothetical protein
VFCFRTSLNSGLVKRTSLWAFNLDKAKIAFGQEGDA